MALLDYSKQSGLFVNIPFKPSPNFNERPPQVPISLIVVHAISLPPGQFGGQNIEYFFLNKLDHTLHPYFQQIKNLQVSAHLVIYRDGRVIQFVPISKRAWHAGDSCFDNQTDCNNFSIGIELEGDEKTPYSQNQYKLLADICKRLMSIYPDITAKRIVGHSDIAPLRKTDPGAVFDWAYFHTLL